MGFVQWRCLCDGLPKWSLKNDQCPKCGKHRDKIKDPDYYIGYYLANGKKRIERAKNLTLSQTRQLLRMRENEVSAGTFFDQKSSGYERLQDLIDAYLGYVRVDKPGFLYHATLYTNRMINFFGNPKFSALSPKGIGEWKLHLRSEGLAESTVDKHLATGSAMFTYCVADVPNPWKRVKHYRPKNQLVRYLTEEQEQKVLQHAYDNYPWLFQALVISIATGLRKQNVLKLKRSQVHWDMGIISVVQKGGSIHNAVLTDDCREILSAIPDNGTDYFWVSPRKGRVGPYTKPDASYKSCLRAAGVDPGRFRFHDLRHHGASKVVRALGILAAKEFLGHVDIANTMRYVHLEQKEYREGINNIGVQVPGGDSKVIPFKKTGS